MIRSFFGVILALSATLSLAQESTRFESTRYGFSLSYPTQFEQVEVNAPGVGLALRFRNATPSNAPSPGEDHYPTMTITVHPQILPPIHETEARVNEVLSSYRKIGLVDTTLISNSIMTRPAGDGLRLLLKYARNGHPYISAVTLLPGKNCHYIFTFIAPEESFKQHEHFEKAVLASIQAEGIQIAKTPPPYPERDRWEVLLSSIFGLSVIAALVWIQRRKRSQ